jgi:hypothetical protein
LVFVAKILAPPVIVAIKDGQSEFPGTLA